MEGVKKKLTDQAHAGSAVLAGCPFAPVGVHQALTQKAAQRQQHARPLGRPQPPPLRLDKIGQVRYGFGIEGFELKLLAHLLGGDVDGIEGCGLGVGHETK